MHLIVLFGPPAVGKMAVGLELCRLTGFRLLHNHMTIEPLLDVFPFGSPAFNRLVHEFRRRILEEACVAGLPGLVFTYVWALEEPGERKVLGEYIEIVESRGGVVSFGELAASLATRLERNQTALRLDRKRSKRDLAFSRDNVLELDRGFVMNTGGPPTRGDELLAGRAHVRVDNDTLSVEESARRIVQALGLGSVQ